MIELSKHITWAEKNNSVVIYTNYNYYFFKGKSKDRIKKILENPEHHDKRTIPSAFYTYLTQKKILENGEK
ncbi:MAG: hypothetical protein WC875_01890 [Candidatus Absconditabacterales bacterium]